MSKILMVEDDVLTAHLYRTSLEKAGYAVELASDGQINLNWLAQISPDAVILDIMVPKVNGLELLKRIRLDARFLHLPVFLYTNALIPAFVEHGRTYGARDIFEKSKLTPKKLLEIIKIALAGA